eukprot:1138393-Pelagomonas_calceolata.AAC.2
MRSANPLELSQLVVDLRSHHLAYWRQVSSYHPRDLNSKRSTYHHWCALPTKNAHVTYSSNVLAKYAVTPRSVFFRSSMLPYFLAFSFLSPTLLLRWLLTCYHSPASARSPGIVWVWGGTGGASQGDRKPGQTW